METMSVSWKRSNVWTGMARLAVLLAAALAITNLGLPQAITGPLVNALLLLTVEWCGVSHAIVVGIATPMGALLRGVLPLPLFVMVPFIAAGNAVLVSVYGALREKNRWAAVAVAAFGKFVLLYASVTLLSARPLSLLASGGTQVAAIPDVVANMMTWPQLATALAGGAIAFGVLGLQRVRSK